MFALHSLRQSAACSQLRLSRRLFPSFSTRSLSTQTRPQTTAKRPALGQSTTAGNGRKPSAPAFKYPELLNVYRAGSIITVFTGMFRLLAVGICATGVFWVAPTFYSSPDHSTLWVPVVIAISPLPWIILTLAQGPIVHSVKVKLPDYARQTRESLLRFAKNVPPETKLQLECMRTSIWPSKRFVKFGMLQRIRPSMRVGHVNLEQILDPRSAKRGNAFWTWATRRWLGLFWISTNQKKNRSAAPGIWENMWPQIPQEGMNTYANATEPVTAAKRPIAPQVLPPRRVGPKR